MALSAAEDSPEPDGSQPALTSRPAFRAYLAAIGAFMLPGGVMAVLFPWLVAVRLEAAPERVGLAQMAFQLPTLLLVVLAGALADRLEPRRILLVLHVVATLPPLLLAAVLLNRELSYGIMIVFALLAGSANALAMPARDTLLNHVAADQIQRAVGFAFGLQFLVHIAGFGIGGLADRFGPVPLLVLMATIMLSGTLAAARLPTRAGPRSAAGAPRLRDLMEGMSIALSSARILPALILTFGTGIFYAGSFLVLLPLIVRDVYGGSAGEIALGFTSLMVGTLISIGFVVLGPGVRRQGRALLLSLGSSGVIFLALTAAPPLGGFYVTIFLWGMCGGVAMIMSRTIIQESAPESHRGRVLALYSLANFGGMPIGSLMLGYAAALFGPLNAVVIPALAMVLLCIAVGLTTPLWRD